MGLRKVLNDKHMVEREFSRFDRDKDGCLNSLEFGDLLINLTGGNIDQDELHAAFVIFDVDGNDLISVKEFKLWWDSFDCNENHNITHTSVNVGNRYKGI